MFEYYDKNDAGCLDYKALTRELLASKSKQPSQYRPSSRQSPSSSNRSLTGYRQPADNRKEERCMSSRGERREAEIEKIVASMREQVLRQGLFGMVRFGKNLKVESSGY